MLWLPMKSWLSLLICCCIQFGRASAKKKAHEFWLGLHLLIRLERRTPDPHNNISHSCIWSSGVHTQHINAHTHFLHLLGSYLRWRASRCEDRRGRWLRNFILCDWFNVLLNVDLLCCSLGCYIVAMPPWSRPCSKVGRCWIECTRTIIPLPCLALEALEALHDFWSILVRKFQNGPREIPGEIEIGQIQANSPKTSQMETSV